MKWLLPDNRALKVIAILYLQYTSQIIEYILLMGRCFRLSKNCNNLEQSGGKKKCYLQSTV